MIFLILWLVAYIHYLNVRFLVFKIITLCHKVNILQDKKPGAYFPAQNQQSHPKENTILEQWIENV